MIGEKIEDIKFEMDRRYRHGDAKTLKDCSSLSELKAHLKYAFAFRDYIIGGLIFINGFVMPFGILFHIVGAGYILVSWYSFKRYFG
jgi:hypothetical protein